MKNLPHDESQKRPRCGNESRQKRKVRVATSANFYFYGTVTEDRLKQFSEVAETHLAELAKRYPLPTGEQAFRGRLAVFVTKDRFDYEEFNTVLMNRRTPKAVSGHSVISANFETAYVAMHDAGDTESASALTD